MLCRFVLENDRRTVRCSSIRLRPRFFSCQQRSRVRQALLHYKALKRCEPTVIVTGAIIRFTAFCVDLEFFSEHSRPFFPGKMALRGQPNGEREGRCLPWLGKDRAAFIAWKAR
jgi:hypothetical protein